MVTSDKNLQKIEAFLSEHHVLSLATCSENNIATCNLFYAFDDKSNSFIIASSDDTLHVQQAKQNPNVAGTVVLETKTVGKIQGIQFNGEFLENKEERLRTLYFKTFPYAIALSPKLWQIKINYFKMTDNKLGFGKKLIWQAVSE